jgi:signal transduction histidine kinase
LAGRITLTLLAGLLAFHLGSLWLLEQGVLGAAEEGREEQVAERLATAKRTIGSLPDEVRGTAAGALSSPDLDIAWHRAASAAAPAEQRLEPLRARLRELVPDLAELHLGYVGTGAERRIGGGMRLADGSWIAFAAPALHRAEASPHASLASLSAMALGIVLASVLVVRWITKPLRRLAEAAEGFGKGAAAPVPMPEDGPREVREAAHAFNAMQARIHRLVSDRTQALAAVSHDLRTPIQRLRLRAGFLDDAEAQRSIDADLDEMEAMVEATLAFLRGDADSEEPRPTDLAAILRTLCDEAADRGAAVAFDGPDHVLLQLRPVAAKRAFANLIDNALKYGAAAQVTVRDSLAEVVVLVEDDGPGIPEAAMATVFEPFQRLEASRNRGTGGTGLGLTIARRALEGHGGTIALANRPGGGLVVTVRLPREDMPRSEGGQG